MTRFSNRICSALVLVALLAHPLSAAADSPINRRDGFLTLWQSLRREIYDNREAAFSDVAETAPGGREITFAKARGVLDDEEENFDPEGALHLSDALVWLYRTRNVDEPERITAATLSGYLLRYPIADLSDDESGQQPVSEEDLLTLMRMLDEALNTEVHEVSLYGEKFHGKGTAFGETFDMNALTAAHRTYPPNTLVRVTNVANGKSVTVRINDRGPYHPGRDMDLSVAAFTSIADRSLGKINTTFQRLGDATIVQACSDDPPRQQRLSKAIILDPGVPHTLRLGGSLTIASKERFVVRGVRYPDGFTQKMQDFVFPGETYFLKPSVEGEYVFTLGTIDGRKREMTMRVVKCL